MIMEFHISWRHRSRLHCWICRYVRSYGIIIVLSDTSPLALFHVDGSTVFDESGCVSKYQTHVTAARNKTGLSADLSLNWIFEPRLLMMQPTVCTWCVDVLLASVVNDSPDWLRRNEAYTQTFSAMSSLDIAVTNTVETGTIDWFLIHSSPCHLHFFWQVLFPLCLPALQENKKKRQRELDMLRCQMRKGFNGIQETGKHGIVGKVKVHNKVSINVAFFISINYIL